MKPVDQQVEHDPPRSYGDCWRCAIASVLEVPAEHVPHFMANGKGADEVWEKSAKWLVAHHGLILASFVFDHPARDVLSFMEEKNKGIYYILSGPSPRGTVHSVVACGGEIAHDPHPSRAGLLLEELPKGRQFWVEIFTPHTDCRIDVRREDGRDA